MTLAAEKVAIIVTAVQVQVQGSGCRKQLPVWDYIKWEAGIVLPTITEGIEFKKEE